MADNESQNKTQANKEKNEETENAGRRKFIKNTGLVAGGVIGGSLFGGLFGNMFKSEPASTDSSEEAQPNFREARMFFSRVEDFSVLTAAVERIYPENDNGPGAIELGVPYFIDSQLAGDFGSNAKVYMQGPFKNVTDPSRYETMMTRGDIFIAGLRKMQAISKDKFEDAFDSIEAKQQDEILQDLQEGEVEIRGVSSITFFDLLRQMTLEGVYSDPLYGGNKNMEGWKMREYPGPRTGYINDIESDDFVEFDPISLKDYMP